MSNPNPIPFAKTGAAANPNGRPKKNWTWAGLYEQAAEEELKTTDGQIKEKAKVFIAKKLVRMAVDGDIAAIKEITNRMDGMPKQTGDHNVTIVTPILGGQTNVPTHISNQEVDETP